MCWITNGIEQAEFGNMNKRPTKIYSNFLYLVLYFWLWILLQINKPDNIESLLKGKDIIRGDHDNMVYLEENTEIMLVRHMIKDRAKPEVYSQNEKWK